MEIEEREQKLKKEANSQNHTPSSNSNNIINSRNNQIEENNSKNQLKLGEFMLTPLEGIILNKKMPHGYKFETEENFLKFSEASKISSKRIRPSDRHNDHQKHPKAIKNQINEDKNININKDYQLNNNKKIKKIVPKDNSSNLSNNNISNNSEVYKIKMKCYSCFSKIKSNPISNFFYQSKFPDSPSLSIIEKKIKNFEYKSINEFCEDLRKLWNFHFKNYAKEPNIYQNICKMSVLSDQICKELVNDKVIENNKEEFSNIKKRTDKIKKDLDEIKGNNQTEVHNKNIRQKSIEEINRLSQLIRSLNKEQLKGIIPILSDKSEKTNSKTFEFDLDKLPYDKYKNLEEYVLSCKNNKNPMNNNNINHKNLKLNKDNNKSENKNNKNLNEAESKDKINVNITKNNNSSNIKNNNSSNVNNNNSSNFKNNNSSNSTINKNSNMKGKDINNNNLSEKKKEEKKIIREKKSFSDSDSLSSGSSQTN